MIGSVGQGDSTPKITLSEFSTSKELMEKELDARVKSKQGQAFQANTLQYFLGSRRVTATLSSSYGVGGLLYSPAVETRGDP